MNSGKIFPIRMSAVGTKIIAPLLVGALSYFGSVDSGSAIPITYTFSGNGSGVFDNHSFVGVSFTITTMADIAQIVNSSSGVYRVSNFASSIFVTGIGSDSFTVATETVLNKNSGKVGLSSISQGLAILFDVNSTFSSSGYSLGIAEPVTSGTAIFNNGSQFLTTGGSFSLTSVSGVSFTSSFPAVNLAVPEGTSTLELLAITLASIGGLACFADLRSRKTA